MIVAREIAERLKAAAQLERDCRRNLNDAKYKSAQQAAVDAIELRDDKELWLQFINDPFWDTVEGEKPKPGHRQQALKFTVRMATAGSAQTRSDRKRAIDILLNERTDPNEIAGELGKRGGFKNVLKSSTESQCNSASSSGNYPQRATGRQAKSNRRSSDVPFDPNTDLAINMTQVAGKFRNMLTGNDTVFQIGFSRTQDVNGHRVFEAFHAMSFDR